MSVAVAIIAAQRSGTHALGSVLLFNGFVNYDEIYLYKQIPDTLQEKVSFRSFIERSEYHKRDLMFHQDFVNREYFKYLGRLDTKPHYVDVKYNTLRRISAEYIELSDRPPILSQLIERGYRIIHLVRENALERFLSNKVAEATGQWHVRINDPDHAIKAPPSIQIDVEECVADIRRHLRSIEMVHEWLEGVPHVLPLVYERLFEGNGITAEAVADFAEKIDITITDPRYGLKKPPRSTREVITNYDEVAEALTRHGYGAMLPGP